MEGRGGRKKRNVEIHEICGGNVEYSAKNVDSTISVYSQVTKARKLSSFRTNRFLVFTFAPRALVFLFHLWKQCTLYEENKKGICFFLPSVKSDMKLHWKILSIATPYPRILSLVLA